jgi:hypothetical protein
MESVRWQPRNGAARVMLAYEVSMDLVQMLAVPLGGRNAVVVLLPGGST